MDEDLYIKIKEIEEKKENENFLEKNLENEISNKY